MRFKRKTIVKDFPMRLDKPRQQGARMFDILYVIATCALFALTALYIPSCDHL